MKTTRSTLAFRTLLSTLLIAPVLVGCNNVDRTERGITNVKRSEHGSHMAPPQVKVSQVQRSGPGPEVGDHWKAWVSLNVCGHFLDPLAGVEVGGITARPDGTVEITPRTQAEAGHNATLDSYIESVGAKLSSGSLTLPASIVPSEIEVKEDTVPVAGRTFTDGQECSGVKGKVAVWVYSPEAIRTGNGLVVVVDDPEQIPFFTDGMALVVTFTPESSLPTLPPAAAVGSASSSGS